MLTSQNAQLNTAFSILGLSAKEVTIYLTLLEIGSSTVLRVAQASQLKRPTCYFVLEQLAARGLVSLSKERNKTEYVAISPKQLYQLVESRYNKFKDNYPQILAIANKSIDKPEIQLFQGKEGVVQASNLALMQPKGSEVLIYGSLLIHQDYPEFIEEFTKTRIKNSISMRLLYADSEENKKILERDNKKELRTIRFLPQKYFDLKTQLYIFSNTLIHIAHSETEPFATVIESKALADDEKKEI